MGCGSNPDRWRRCLPATFLLVVTKQLREQLKEGRIYLGSQFEGAVHLWWGKHGDRNKRWSQGIDTVRTASCPFHSVQGSGPSLKGGGSCQHLGCTFPSLVKDPRRQTCPEVYLLGDSRPRQLKTNYHQEENTLWIQIYFLHDPSTCIQSSHMIFLKLFVWYI